MTPEILLARIDATVLYPPFVAKLTKMLQLLLDQERQFYVTSGLRTFTEQDMLYTFGRTNKSRGIVTNARAGYSNHNFAIAVDCAFDRDNAKPGLQPAYDSPLYQPLADAALTLDLDPGFYWKSFKDGPHVQLDLGKHGITISKLRQVYLKDGGGHPAVFKYLDGFTW